MNAFATALQHTVARCIDVFADEMPGQHIYGFAAIPYQDSAGLHFALGTAEGLETIARKYRELGYVDTRVDEEDLPDLQLDAKLQDWLRWANPDDGWFYREISAPDELAPFMEEIGRDPEWWNLLESECVNAFRDTVRDASWKRLSRDGNVVVGITAGSNPDDYLRTATMIHDSSTTKRLWREFSRARALSARIARRR